MIETDNLEKLVECVSCDVRDKACMYGECKIRSEKLIPIAYSDANAQTSWNIWKTVREDRAVKKQGRTEQKSVTLTAKHMETGSVSDLADDFNDQLTRFKTHCFNIQNLKQEMGPNEALIDIDFAEHYNGKTANAIQSAHFGASQNQITLHTGVLYVGANSKPQSFCTVSESLEHGPGAIWVLLSPILDDLQAQHPNVKILHFFSDGPTTQYRQKGNFYLFSTVIFKRGFKLASWNFHEAGHGKGYFVSTITKCQPIHRY